MAFTEEQIKAFPVWLQKLVKLAPEQRTALGYSDEDLEQATKAYHLDKDYTQKSQKAAVLEKIQEQYPDINLEDAGKVYAWWQTHGEEVQQLWPNRARLREILARPAADTRENGNGDRPKRRSWRDAEATDLYETARLRETFEDLETSAAEAGEKRMRAWYDKEEVPRLDGVAAGYLQTAVNLIELGRDPRFAALKLADILKSGAASGERDLIKVATGLLTTTAETRKGGYDEGYQKGIEEGKKAAPAAEGPSGPIGGASPTWRPTPASQQPKTRDERANAVIGAVEKKHGVKLPL